MAVEVDKVKCMHFNFESEDEQLDRDERTDEGPCRLFKDGNASSDYVDFKIILIFYNMTQ